MAPDAPMGQAAESKPAPDPTILTTEQLIRSIEAERVLTTAKLRIIDERINGIDTATSLRVSDLPQRVDEKVTNAREMADLRTSYERQISDIRIEAAAVLAARVEQLNALALAAALAAQKESAQTQATTFGDALAALGRIVETSLAGLGDKVDDVKDRVGRIENIKVGASESTTERRQSNSATYGLIGAVGGMIGTAIVVIGLVMASNP